MSKQETLKLQTTDVPHKSNTKCFGNKTEITRICVQMECKHSNNRSMCGNVKCQCHKNHGQCPQFISFQFLDGLLAKFQNMASQDLFSKMMRRLKTMIEKAIQNYNELFKKVGTFMMMKPFKGVQQSIYESGIIPNKLCLQMNQKLTKYHFEVPKLMNFQPYKNSVEEIIKKCEDQLKITNKFYTELNEKVTKHEQLSMDIIEDYNKKYTEKEKQNSGQNVMIMRQ